jgi:hypothetical protein
MLAEPRCNPLAAHRFRRQEDMQARLKMQTEVVSSLHVGFDQLYKRINLNRSMKD